MGFLVFFLTKVHFFTSSTRVVGGFTLSGLLDYSCRGHRCVTPSPPRYAPSFTSRRGFKTIPIARRFCIGFYQLALSHLLSATERDSEKVLCMIECNSQTPTPTQPPARMTDYSTATRSPLKLAIHVHLHCVVHTVLYAYAHHHHNQRLLAVWYTHHHRTWRTIMIDADNNQRWTCTKKLARKQTIMVPSTHPPCTLL